MARKVTSLTFDLFGRDRTASKSMKGVGDQAGKTAQTLQRAGVAMAAGIAVAGAAAVKFGIDSVRAFAEAEEAQNRLAFAFEKFPKLADTSLVALQRFNAELMRKTRFDDDAIASGQAVLAQFGLTGDQLRRLTPLLLDYAGATGKDLTTSAEDLGRALLGQGRALKVLGIDFSDAGSVAANFDQLMGKLSEKVGGFAERDAETAAGKLDILTNRFGEVQEAVGEALLPALDKLLEWIEGDGLRALEGFATWFAEDGVDALSSFIDKISEMAEDGTLVPSIVGGLAAITAAQYGLNAAMLANPIGLVVGAIAILAAQVTYVIAFWEDFKQSASDDSWAMALRVLLTGNVGLIAWFAQNWDAAWYGIQSGVVHAVNGMIHALNFLLRGLQPVVDAFNFIFGTKFKLEMGLIALPTAPNMGGVSVQDPARRTGGFVAMAEGGIVRPTPGGTRAVIGEAGYPEAVIPLTRSGLAAYGLGGGDTIVIQMRDSFVGSEDQLARKLESVVSRARRRGTGREMGFATS